MLARRLLPYALVFATCSSSASEPLDARAQPTSVVRFQPAGDSDDVLPLEVAFDRDVDRRAVERAFAIEPPVEGRFEWEGQRGFRFLPSVAVHSRAGTRVERRWPRGKRFEVRVAGRDARGEPLRGLEWSFRTRVPAPGEVRPGGGATITLSFDDGPFHRWQADDLVRTLAQHRAKAIFFPTGKWAKGHSQWVERAERAGHLVCNHTATHRMLTSPALSDDDVRAEIRGGAGVGRCPLFRPPYMAIDARVQRIAKELGYRTLLWDIDSHDWEIDDAQDLTHRVLQRVHPGGAVVLFHMHSEATSEALPAVLEELEDAGYILSYDRRDKLNATQLRRWREYRRRHVKDGRKSPRPLPRSRHTRPAVFDLPEPPITGLDRPELTRRPAAQPAGFDGD